MKFKKNNVKYHRMLIDEITIKVTAGKGGDGIVAFQKNKRALGPTGGNGGKGGNIYLEGISDLNALHQFRYKKELEAENGKNGRPQLNDGTNGKDLTLKIPIGTVIHNLTKKHAKETEITRIGEQILIAKGGHGGKGNFRFRSPRNTTPKECEPGLPGENFTIRLELKLIADIGLIGLPNAGKSTLLNALTNAKAKTANYPFTTLEPNLGVYYDLILADIPGLIEGASLGKGLGAKFLRHIERTKTLFHLISAESENPENDYAVIRNELKNHNPALLEKPEYIFLTKCDLVSEEKIQNSIKALAKIKLQVIPLSIHKKETLINIQKILNKLIDQKKTNIIL